MKTIKQDNRILLLGTTGAPFDAPVKPLCKQYQSTIMIPRPDYASRFCNSLDFDFVFFLISKFYYSKNKVMWKSFITKNGGILSPSLDLSSLTKISDGFTPGHILSSVKEVLTDRRISQQQSKPLHASEFIPGLARNDPIYKEEEESFKKWWSKTPLGIKRARAAAENEEGGGKKGAKGKGGKGGKKKK